MTATICLALALWLVGSLLVAAVFHLCAQAYRRRNDT